MCFQGLFRIMARVKHYSNSFTPLKKMATNIIINIIHFFRLNVPNNALYRVYSDGSAPLNKMVDKPINVITLKITSPPEHCLNLFFIFKI